MQENQNFIDQIVEVISIKYPVLGKIIGISTAAFFMTLGITFPDIHDVVPVIYKIEIPKIFMQLFQAWLGLGGFMIALATFIGKDKKK